MGDRMDTHEVVEEEDEEMDNTNEEEELDSKQILEEYKVWKKNSPFLYDFVVTNALEWPSLTCQWLKKKLIVEGQDYSEHELLLGTHTSDEHQNHLMIARVKLPNDDTQLDVRKYDDERGELGGYGGAASKIEIKVRLNHDAEVNRARYMPQDDYVIATKTVSGQVHVFFIRDHESTPGTDGPAQPNVRCIGHEQEGYGLDWNNHIRGYLASASDDSTVCIWDVMGSNVTENGLEPLIKFSAHESNINDVQWHQHHDKLFGTVGDDRKLNLFDTRDVKTPKSSIFAHEQEAQTIAFSPFNESLLLSGGNDQLIKLWDMRKMNRALHEFSGHQGDIFKVEWAPFNEAVMASCSADRRVLVWDLGRIGQEQTAEDAEDGPPELLFIHGGHCSKVSDISWNQNDPWVLSSVSEDNVVQIWQMAENIYTDDGDINVNDSKVPADENLE